MWEKRRYRKQLEQTFCWKIGAELKLFQYQTLQKDKEAIYYAAYQIDCTICIYKLLLEMSGKLSEEILEAVIAFPGILTYLYGEWMSYRDSHVEDIQHCLKQELGKISADHKNVRMERAV